MDWSQFKDAVLNILTCVLLALLQHPGLKTQELAR